MATPSCPNCGTSVEAWARYCSRCGASITPSAPQAAPMSASPTPGDFYASHGWQRIAKEIDRTRTGLLLIFIGAILTLVPIITVLGGLLILIGAVLAVLGRRAFGPRHSRNVMASVGLAIAMGVGGIVIVAVAISLAFSQLGTQPPSDPDLASEMMASALADMMAILLPGLVILMGLWAVGILIFTYALQERIGRILLWGGFGLNLVSQAAPLLLLREGLEPLLEAGFSGNPGSPTLLFELGPGILALSALGMVATIVNAAAVYLAWSRIKRGEIPSPHAPIAPGLAPTPLPPGQA